VVGIGSLAAGWDLAGWVASALAALAKPQAWALLPLVVIATLRLRQPRRLALDAAVGLLTALIVALPFVVTGRVGQLLSLPRTVSTVMPVVSADAHNLWWIVLAPHSENAIFTFDSEPLLGPLSFRLAAGLLVGASLVVSAWLYWTRRASLPEAAALTVLGWFAFTTQAHENHLFFALPLLALAWPERRALLVVYAVLSTTLLLNMALHDELLLEALGVSPDEGAVHLLRVADAAANVTTCLAWTVWAVVRPAGAAVRRDEASPVHAVEALAHL
jgi:hypothetical protein